MSRSFFIARRASARLLALMLAMTSVGAVSASAFSLGPSNSQRRVLALSEAHRLLDLIALPAGAHRAARTDPSIGPTLLSMGPLSADPDQVDLTRFYLVSRGDWALSWLENHVPRGGRRTEWGTGGGPGTPTSHTVTFSFATPPSLSQGELSYSMMITPSGELGLRVDANVLWTPRKSRFSLVARGATTVVVTMNRGMNVKFHRVTKETVTSHSEIAAIRSAINSAPVAPAGVESCPVDVGATMTLAFSRSTSPYVVVTADPGGCGSITVTQMGSSGDVLGVGHDSGGFSVVRFLAKSLGIKNWTGI